MSRSNAKLVVALIILVCTQAARINAKAPTRADVQQANALADRLMMLDNMSKSSFIQSHPGVLPETTLKLPNTGAVSFDWCNLNKVSESHRQRSEDCWANAAVEALECSNLIRNNRRYILSAQPVLDHLKLGASGNEIREQPSVACQYFVTTGTARTADYPYTGKPATPKEIALNYRAVAWGYVSDDEKAPTTEQLKNALLRHGPLVVDLTDTVKFHAYQGGLYNEPTPDKSEVKGRHAVLLVGWDDSRGEHGAWKIKNTWGPDWGEQGFMWIARGSNNFARYAEWVCAASLYYSLPAEGFAQLMPQANPLPAVHFGESAKPQAMQMVATNAAPTPPLAPRSNENGLGSWIP